jgi:hypothetical protein
MKFAMSADKLLARAAVLQFNEVGLMEFFAEFYSGDSQESRLDSYGRILATALLGVMRAQDKVRGEETSPPDESAVKIEPDSQESAEGEGDES